MKNNLFISVVALLTLISCNKEDAAFDNYAQIPESQNVESFCAKIDSLNNAYSEMLNDNATRGYVSDYAITSSADAVGAFVGAKLFSWAGSAIGAACANPALACGGYFIGKKIGRAAGSAAASIGAAWLIDKFGTRSTINTSLVLNEDYVVSIEDPNNLTEGELHNLILAELLKNIDKYVMPDGSLNYELLLSDAYMFENQFAPFEEYPGYKELWLPKAIEQTRRIVDASVTLESNNSALFLDEVYNGLIPELQITKEEFENANILNEKVLSTYTMLDNVTLKEFSKDIDDVIESSNLNDELKDELKVSNSVMTNSTLIWREVQ